MFTVDNYKITFHHMAIDPKESPDTYVLYKYTTRCDVRDISTGKIISSGVSWCSPKDNINKNVGRKVALTHAISRFPKNVRTNIWGNYFKMTSGKKV